MRMRKGKRVMLLDEPKEWNCRAERKKTEALYTIAYPTALTTSMASPAED